MKSGESLQYIESKEIAKYSMNYNILIAEDEREVREILRVFLEEKGYSVAEAEDGKIALHLFQQSRFDLILADYVMPEMDGLKLLQAVKEINPEIPVIIISAHHRPEIIIEALRHGACDYLIKPFLDTDIHQSIERISRLKSGSAGSKTDQWLPVKESRTYVFENNPDHIPDIARFLCRDLPALDSRAAIQSIQVSLFEALTNAIFHGNLEIQSSPETGSDLDSFTGIHQLAGERIREKPYCDRRVTVECAWDEEKVYFRIHDEGDGFDHRKLPGLLTHDSLTKTSGRGLLMIRSFCDEVFWNDAGNEITMVKQFKHKQSAGPSND